MRGHHQISPKYVEEILRQVKAKRMTPKDAGEELAKLCVCGIFNPIRAAKIIMKMAERER